ncbi:protein FAM83D [Antechinus flavipes]|uniref:protein FAM83D n=1 Tax=Antechinus flavipes TaxID=38775 RepID=UPI0022362F5A|nr:protein FAM83D [Antechinus flavipes]
MATPSQLLDDLAASCLSPGGPPNLPELYSEAQRLAVEELVTGGRDAFITFLRRENVTCFLSEEEIQSILQTAVRPRARGEDSATDESFASSQDCSSLTYFPEQSDIEPPVLELGWPAFYRGAYRGPTRVEAHFQPCFQESPYGCKDAVRKQIRSAKEVIAVVMESFTDIDIFRDLQEVCRKQEVAVYILLDQALIRHFLDMCVNLRVHPEQEKLMTVRTITGNAYYARSGTKIVGKIHEKFMLIDGIRVATGSYGFTWTDGKLNSSNLVILSGQVVEHFDLEFRILYAQSKPISSKLLSVCRNSDRFDHLINRKPPSRELTLGNLLRMRLARLSSTPSKADVGSEVPVEEKMETTCYDSETSTISEEDCLSQEAELELLKGNDVSTQTEPWETMLAMNTCEVGTQTHIPTVCDGTQTVVATRVTGSQTMFLSKSVTTQTVSEPVEPSFSQGTRSKDVSPASKMSTAPSTSSSVRSFSSLSSQGSVASSVGSHSSTRATEFLNPGYPKYSHNPQKDVCLRDSFRNLNKERQFHFSGIRSRLNHMLTLLSRRTVLAESYLGCNPGSYTRTPLSGVGNNLLAIRDIALYPSYR